MLNLKGAYIVVSESCVTPHLLAHTANELHSDRIRVVGHAKANNVTFGTGTLYAFPCTQMMMEHLIENYTGLHATQVQALAALVLLRMPFPNGSDDGKDGGMKVEAETSKPKKPKGSGGVKLQIPEESRA